MRLNLTNTIIFFRISQKIKYRYKKKLTKECVWLNNSGAF